MTPEEFLNFVFADRDEESEVVCVAKASPKENGDVLFWNVAPDHDAFTKWCRRAERMKQAWYFCVSTVNGTLNEKGTALKRRRVDLVRYHCLTLDDIGTKAKAPPVEPAWEMESSPENYQWGYLLEPGTDWWRYEGLLDWCHDQGWGDGGAGGTYRVMRVPLSANLKPGKGQFLSRLKVVDDVVYTLDALGEALGIDAATWRQYADAAERRAGGTSHGVRAAGRGEAANDTVDPVLTWLSDNGYVAKDDGGDWVDIKCPWHEAHTTGADTAGYSPLGRGLDRWSWRRSFKCLHEHCKDKRFREFREWAEERGAPAVAGFDPLPVVQRRWVHIVDGKRAADMEQRLKGGKWIYGLDEFGNRHYVQVATPYRDDTVLLRTAFLESEHTQVAETMAYSPGGAEIAVVNGQQVVNTYIEPQHPETDAEPTVFLEHAAYILPDPTERELFLDWLAWKIQHPARRSYAIVMVADEAYGTGRSWMAEMLAEALEGKVNKATLAQLIGKGTSGEANYNDWAAECQFLVVEEAKDVTKEDFWSSYDTVKERIDNRAHKFWRNTKYGAARYDHMYFNALIFSNHSDALVMPDNDRRFAVLTNPTERREPEYYDVLNEALDTDEPAKVYWYLKRRDVDAFDHVYPPMTEAKQAMIEQSRSAYDEIRDWLLDNLDGDVITFKMLLGKVRLAARELGHSKVESDPSGVAKRVWRKFGTLRKGAKNGARYMIDGKQQEVRALRNRADWVEIDADRAKETIEKSLAANMTEVISIGVGAMTS
jgi:hypothetical protein